MNKTVYFLIDCSGSMYGKRGDAVNDAMEEVAKKVVPEIIAQKNADMKIKFKVLGFSGENTIKQIVGETDLEDFAKQWQPIPAAAFDGGTPTGAAIQAVIQDIQGGCHGDKDPDALPPAIILISDGEPNGKDPTYDEVLECAVKGGDKEIADFRRTIRIAIGMNVNDSGRESLKKFGNVSNKMAKNGIPSYYDCSDQYTDQFIEILKSATMMASMQV